MICAGAGRIWLCTGITGALTLAITGWLTAAACC